jgi:hypothetical protein
MSSDAVKLLQEVLNLITLYPEIHEQGDWMYVPYDAHSRWKREPGQVLPLKFDPANPTACGTKACLAGNAFLMSGRYPMRYQVDDDDTGELHVQFLRDNAWHDVDPYVHGEAAEILNLTRDEMFELFEGDNSLERLWTLASEFSGGRVRRPPNEWFAARRQRDTGFRS